MLKSTGIVRRLDGLRRVAIPLSVGRLVGIRANTPVEFFVDESNRTITLKAFSMDMDSDAIADQIREMVNRTAGTASAGELANILRDLAHDLDKSIED